MDLSQFSTWTVIAWAIATAWVAIIIIFISSSRRQASLVPLDGLPDPVQGPKLSVLVAARNETKCIETCIRSLFQQDYPDLEVVAINDRSTDDTAQILDRLADEFGERLKVIHVNYLPNGWFGKPHALTLGLQSATGSVICFTDADCIFESPSAMRTTVTELFRRDLDFLSLAARYSMNSLREAVAVPCCSEALMTWLRPERIEDPRWDDAFANGAFIMVRKAPFDRIGGWGAVRTQISEDLQLARLAKREGLRVGVAHGKGFYRTASYPTWRDSWNGWSRIFKGTLTPAQLLITVGRMSILFLMPLVAVLGGLWEGVSTGSFEWLTYGTGLGFLIAFFLRCTLDLTVFRLLGAPLLAMPLAPLGRLYVMAASMRALLSHAGLVGTHWRGSTFVAGQLVLAKQPKA